MNNYSSHPFDTYSPGKKKLANLHELFNFDPDEPNNLRELADQRIRLLLAQESLGVTIDERLTRLRPQDLLWHTI